MATRTQQNGRSIVCALSLKLNPSVTNSPAVRRACCVMRFINESGAKGCEVVVSGKLRGQRAKSMEFVDGFMIHSGDPCYDYVETATGHVLLRQGVLGIKVKITNYDPKSKIGPRKPLPNVVEPKEEEIYETTETEYKMPAIVPIYDEAADI